MVNVHDSNNIPRLLFVSGRTEENVKEALKMVSIN